MLRLAGQEEAGSGATLNCALWVLGHGAVYERLGTSPSATTDVFETWLATVDPLQAWITRAAWIPEFDVYDAYTQTLYEQAATVDWFRSGLQGTLTGQSWLERRLRF